MFYVYLYVSDKNSIVQNKDQLVGKHSVLLNVCLWKTSENCSSFGQKNDRVKFAHIINMPDFSLIIPENSAKISILD